MSKESEESERKVELRKIKLIEAGYKAVDELIKVAEDDILKTLPKKKPARKKGEEESSELSDTEYSLSADRLKNAAAAKKLAIFDGFEILAKIEAVQADLDSSKNGANRLNSSKGLAESRAK